MFDVQQFVMAVLSGGFLLGPLVYQLFDKVPALADLQPDYKRFVVLVVCAVLGAVFWGFAVWMQYIAAPSTPQLVVEELISAAVTVAGAGYISSSLIHGVRELKPKA